MEKKIVVCTANMDNMLLAQKIGTTQDLGIYSIKPEVPAGYCFAPPAAEDNYIWPDAENRKLTAIALKRGGNDLPDVLVMQEVGSGATLDSFNREYLGDAYPYTIFVPCHYSRFFSVAVMSKYPMVSIRSHKDEKNGNGEYIFQRDCLEVTLDIDGAPFTIFACHLKSRVGKDREAMAAANAKRLLEAERVAAIVRERFPGDSFNTAAFAVMGDMNDPYDSETVKPFFNIGLEDVMGRLPLEQRWTATWMARKIVQHFDHIIISPSLVRSNEGKLPFIERKGLPAMKEQVASFETSNGVLEVPFDFGRFEGVDEKVFASDHAFVFFEVTLP